MSRFHHGFVLSLLFSFFAACPLLGTEENPRRPNVVFIMADDLGYGELGCYGQKWVRTPHLDRLAAEGMRFTQHYSGSPVCAPARCTLMTGKHGGHAFIRDNGNPPGREHKPNEGLFPGQHPIPAEEVTLAEQFHELGYATGAMGKWGLGYEGSSGDPNRQGFDLFFGYLCQVHAHSHYPRFLWRNGERVEYEGNERQLLGKHHSQDAFVEEALAFIRASADRPFFLYLPFAVPHLSIQAPEEAVQPYLETIPEEEYEHKGYLKHPTPRAGYAAMVTRMDEGIGRVLALLEELGLREETIVVFTSDNGPTYDRLGGSDSEFFNSAPGMRGLKGSVYEGGIKVPMIARWPGRIPEGRVSDLPTYFPDWMPTLLDLVGAAESIPENIDGQSFSTTLLGQKAREAPRKPLVWEFRGYGGQQAIRLGEWKGVRQRLLRKNLHLELYNLAEDPEEKNDVSDAHPEVVAELTQILAREHMPSKLFPIPVLDGPAGE